MNTKELFLKTLFCCSACDGEIASEEISLLKQIINESDFFDGIDIEALLKEYIDNINSLGKKFLIDYLSELSSAILSNKEQISLIKLAITMIEADNEIQYSEVKFFKKIRLNLTVSDSEILVALPDAEDYLLPDLICDSKEDDWSNISFNPINL